MEQKFWKSIAYMGIMFVAFATTATLVQWVTAR